MSTSTTFFGLTSATADFLHANGIYFTRQAGTLAMFAEKSSSGQVVVYVLFQGSQLRVASLAELQRTFSGISDTPGGLNRLPLEQVESTTHPFGQLVYRTHYDDPNNRHSLVHAAYDAAKSRGVTHATARWFGQYLVQDAFSGLGSNLKFTPQGVRHSLESLMSSESTIRRQLTLLQTAGALTFARDKEGPAYVVRYNKACLPTMAHQLTPHFFSALCYD